MNKYKVWDLSIYRIVFIGIIMFFIGFLFKNGIVVIIGFLISSILLPYSFFVMYKYNRKTFDYTWKEILTLPLFFKK